jgi:hypothetical protein
MPVMPIATAKDALIPSKYARRIPGSCSEGKTDRSCVAPVKISCCGFTPGAFLRTLETSLLTKADWAAEVLKAPLRTWKT